MYNYFEGTRGETDITIVFGTIIGGSIPSECTKEIEET